MNYGCFRIPENCVNKSCEYLAKWRKIDAKIEFLLSTKTGLNSWLGIGFSKDQKMVIYQNKLMLTIFLIEVYLKG